MSKLYTPEILGLAVELADYPRLPSPHARAEARSRTCGGTLTVDLALDPEGRVDTLGLSVSACAIGQAAAAIFAREARGRGAEEMLAALGEIETWLEGGETLPRWPGIGALAPARDFPGRHGAILLPWRAAVDALCKEPQPR
ncbi:MAG: Fe-S cluster protein [Citromicrobium sp.]|nr:Fe-S cluster protein [Citromicrobium sp.]